MKHKQTIRDNSIQYILTNDTFNSLSPNAKWVLLTLCNLRHKFSHTSNENEIFFRQDIDLAKDCKIPRRTLERVKAELKLYPNIIKITQKPFKIKGEILNQKHITTYQLLF